MKWLRAIKYETITEPVRLVAIYWLQSRRKTDLINLIQATADILEDAKVIADDTLISSLDGCRIGGIDKANPRVELTIYKYINK